MFFVYLYNAKLLFLIQILNIYIVKKVPKMSLLPFFYIQNKIYVNYIVKIVSIVTLFILILKFYTT